MALVKDESGKLIRTTSPSRVFREDYRRHTLVSYAEAADYAGMSISTIKNWTCKKKGALPLARRTGPFRIDLLVLDKYLRRGC